MVGVLDADVTLAAARAKGREYSTTRREHPDLKGWLDLEAIRKGEAEEAERRRIEAEQRRGSLVDMLEDYAADLARKGKIATGEVARIIEHDIRKPHPGIAAMRACDMGPEDIKAVLQPIWDRGAQVLYNRVRAVLHAAFIYAARAEYDVARKGTKSFGIKANPVTLVPRQADAERARTVVLSAKQLRIFYTTIGDISGVGAVMAAFLRLCIATGGQRPQQLLRATWGDYDLEQRRVRVVDAKGRGVPRVHLLPLTERAVEILEGVRPITGSYQWPFSVSGKSPVHLSSLKNAINRFLAANNGMPVFTARDLRRSCKQVAMKAGVAARWMNVLQGHEMGGLVGKHYANDPEAWLPERRQAMIAFDAMLGDVLIAKGTAKVIPLRLAAGDLAVQLQSLQ